MIGLRSFLRRSGHAYVALDATGAVTLVSRGFSDIAGGRGAATAESLFGRPWRDLGQAAIAGEPLTIDMAAKTGRPRRCHVRIEALPPGDDALAWLASIVPAQHDENVETALRKELDHLNFALSATAQGVWDYDGATDTWYFSRDWKRLRGIPDDEDYVIQGNDWMDVVHPDDLERVDAIGNRLIAGEIEEVAYEFRERHRDGHWIWIEARGRCLSGHRDGKPVRIVGTDRDITALKQRANEHEAMAHRHDLAITTSALALWDVDIESGVARWDERTRALFGVEPGNGPVPTGTFEARVHPDDLERVVASNAAGFASGRPHGTDFRILLPDGRIRYTRSRMAHMHDVNGRPIIVGVNWDMTEDVAKTEALRVAKEMAEERSRELEEARRRFEHAALHDALTGLPNRRYLDNALLGLAGPEPTAETLTLLHVDLDRFKQINDTLGHAAGDALLVHVGELLRDNIRAGDIVARIGGDEFVVVLAPSPAQADLARIIDRILETAKQPFIWQGHECRSGVSIGIASSVTGPACASILVNADIALYRAKRAGRNRARQFTPELQAEVVERKQCADDILKALERDEFVAFYQPQVDAVTHEIIGVEALVRWHHPTRGLLAPIAFLGVAEDISALDDIDRLMVARVAADVAGWDAAGVRIPRVSVNVSARRLADQSLIDNLTAIPLSARRLSFELLESIFLDDDNEVLTNNIAGLKALGYCIEIDDFGTGHASIASLLRIRPHRLKIDRGLVRPVVDSEAQRRLVRSIIEIGKSMDIAVCAEGVETAAHAEVLRDLGADSLQGYHFSRPVPAAAVMDLARNPPWLAAAMPQAVEALKSVARRSRPAAVRGRLARSAG